jgi:hypothetical protein
VVGARVSLDCNQIGTFGRWNFCINAGCERVNPLEYQRRKHHTGNDQDLREGIQDGSSTAWYYTLNRSLAWKYTSLRAYRPCRKRAGQCSLYHLTGSKSSLGRSLLDLVFTPDDVEGIGVSHDINGPHVSSDLSTDGALT